MLSIVSKKMAIAIYENELDLNIGDAHKYLKKLHSSLGKANNLHSSN